MNILKLLGRDRELFAEDILKNESELNEIISASRFLVIGGAGSIGQMVTKEIINRNPKKLHVIDLSENNLVELVRDIRSSIGYIDGDFQTLPLDVDSVEYDSFIEADGKYDYVLNFSALKHVRSEKDPYSIMRMINVNILNTDKTIQQSIDKGVKKYFCVSSDKAVNPVNIMGASKRIMEMHLLKKSEQIDVSSSRFANVAFSDGSLLYSFNQRILKHQPIVAPYDIKRYFLIPKESGELSLLSCIFGANRDIFFPKLSDYFHMITFPDIVMGYLNDIGYEPYFCHSENEARELVKTLPKKSKWPCFLVKSNTTGEKDFEEFFTKYETLDLELFENIGIIKNDTIIDGDKTEHFTKTINNLKKAGKWTKKELIDLFFDMIPDFDYTEKGKYLDDKM